VACPVQRCRGPSERLAAPQAGRAHMRRAADSVRAHRSSGAAAGNSALASARLPSLPVPFRCRSLFHCPARTVSICAAPPPSL